jgi:hypothetical protein
MTQQQIDQLKLKQHRARTSEQFDDSNALAAEIVIAEAIVSTLPTFDDVPSMDTGFSGFDGGDSGGAGATGDF